MLRRLLWVVGLVCVAAGVAGAQAAPARGRALYGRLPLTFEQNTGRYDKRVRFLARTGGGTLFLTDREAVLSLPVRGAQAPAQARRRPGPTMPGMPEPPAPTRRSVLRMKLAGSAGAASAMGLQRQKGIVNYFIGNDPKKWRTRVPTFARVKLAGVYPGIDLVYYGSPDRALEYDFVVKPGSDPGRIRLAFSGARKLALAANGDLIATTEAGDVRLKRPYAYQQIGGKRVQVACSYNLKSQEARMQIARYDEGRPLVVDPVLVYGTYLGGSSGESIRDVAVDATGRAYVTGNSNSADFPTTAGALQRINRGNSDVFLSLFDPALSHLEFSTYIGGTEVEYTSALAVDQSGNATVVGTCEGGGFPVTEHALQSCSGGWSDGFALRLSSAGTSLEFSTYIGGAGWDYANDVVLDCDGSAIVAAGTQNSQLETTPDSWRSTPAGLSDVYIAHLTRDGSGVVASTFVGGSSSDGPPSLALASDGTIVAGCLSDSSDCYVSSGALQSLNKGGGDIYIVLLSHDLCNALHATFIGGQLTDILWDLDVCYGKIYLCGSTESSDFPVNNMAFQSTKSTGYDGFISCCNITLTDLLSSTYIGGTGNADEVWSLDISLDGSILVSGATTASARCLGLCELGRPAPGKSDGFVAAIKSDLSMIMSGVLIRNAFIYKSVLKNSLAAIATGWTESPYFPVTPGAYQTTLKAGVGFVAEVTLTRPTSTTCSDASAFSGDSIALSANLSTATPATGLAGRSVSFLVNGSPIGTHITDAAGEASMTWVVVGSPGAFAVSAAFAGDDVYEPSSGSGQLTIMPPAQTTLYVPDQSGIQGRGMQLDAELAEQATGSPLPGRLVTFAVDGVALGAATTVASGVASLQWVISVGSTVRTISCAFAGEPAYAAASGVGALRVRIPVATIVFVPDRTGIGAQTVRLKAYLYKKAARTYIDAKPLGFSVDGTAVGSSITNTSGEAYLDWVIGSGVATRTVAAVFAGDEEYGPSNGQGKLMVTTYATSLTLPDRAAELADDVLLKAYLYRDDQTPVEGKAVTFHVDGTEVGSATSNYQGRAMLLFTVPGATAPGRHDLEARWAGNGGYLASSGSAALWVSRAPSYLWLASRTIKQGGAAYLRSYLRRLPDYVWLPGKPVSYKLDGVALGSATTDASGCASLLYTAPPGMALGGHTMVATFAGDATYLANGSAGVLTVTP